MPDKARLFVAAFAGPKLQPYGVLIMLSSFRTFFKSKFGIGFMMLFLGMIALAFAGMDVSNSGSFGGVSGGDRVAIVGDRKVSTSDLSIAANQAFESARQQSPTLSQSAFYSADRMDEIVDQLVQRLGLAEFGRQIGLRAGDRLVDSEIVQIPAFRGPDGKFDQTMYEAAINQQGLSDEAVRQDFAAGLFARQALMPVTFASRVPVKLVKHYASLLKETREGQITMIPSAAFAPNTGPSEAQLNSFYSENKGDYLRPERRVIRYATFGIDAVGDLAAPTEAQIKARYDADSAQYAASEARRLTQLVVPTEAAAKAIVAEVAGGKSLDTAAREKGLATTSIGPVSRAALSSEASQAVATSAFSAGSGTIATPARGSLGWYVLRVDEIERREGRSLEQVRAQISEVLAAEHRQSALEDLSARIEDELDSGGSLAEVAQELKVAVQSTEPATADGQIYGQPGQTVAPVLAPALSTAFSMEEEEPQLAVAEPGRTFLIYEVSDITPSAAAPLAEIKERISSDWKLAQGSAAAKAASDRILAKIKGGKTLAQAIGEEKVSLPPVDTVNLNRAQLQQMGGRVPPVLALFFSMAQGTSKKLEAPNNAGWFIADLDKIQPGEVLDNDPLLASAQSELGPLAGDELAQQFARAVLADIGSETNPAAVKAVRGRLTGQAE